MTDATVSCVRIGHVPAITSEAPEINLVRLWTTTSAPWVAGDSMTGENVLSTTSFTPCSQHARELGLVGK